MKEFEQEVSEYKRTLSGFITTNNLPAEWFTNPDHLAIKCADREDFLRTAAYWRRHAMGGQVSAVDMNKRTLASVHLIHALPVDALGEVEWLEIMEPRPEKVGKGIVGLEHMEFYYPHLDRVMDFLDVRQKEIIAEGIQPELDYVVEENPGHKWVNIVLNDAAQELKINNRPLRDIVADELETYISYYL